MRQSVLSFATKPNTNAMAKFQPAMNSSICGRMRTAKNGLHPKGCRCEGAVKEPCDATLQFIFGAYFVNSVYLEARFRYWFTPKRCVVSRD